MAILLDGKATSAKLQEEIRTRVQAHFTHENAPRLCVILVGENPASASYVRTKCKMAEKLGFRHEVYHFDADVEQSVVEAQIDACNADPQCDAVFVQLPLPKHLDAVVIGRSNIVGKPISLMLQRHNATVTMCHTRTRDLAQHVARADLLVVAAGSPELVKGDWIKPGAIVVDCGFTKTPDGVIHGDVDFEAAAQRAAYITPVPGGVGPMTVITLMEQTLESALAHRG